MRLDLRADLNKLKSQVSAEIDASAEALRGQFITLGAGQAAVYQAKQAEAFAYEANPSIPVAQIPHLTLEAAAFGFTLEVTAQRIIERSVAWNNVSAVIEARRLAAKEAVRVGETAAQVRAAGDVDWSDIAVPDDLTDK